MTRWRVAILVLAALACIALPTALVGRVSFDQPVRLSANGHQFRLLVAETRAARERGLGGRKYLASDVGMLFVFKSPGVQCFWMKDMRFSIDIIWTDSAKRIVHLTPNVSPDSYPTTYCPAVTAQYVIELPAGSIKRDQLTTGQALSF